MQLCQTCLDYSNRLVAKTEEFLAATSSMATVAGMGQREAFEAAQREVERLRGEYDTLNANMKRHKSEHCDTSGCVAAIIAVLKSEFAVLTDLTVDRSSSPAHVSFRILEERYRVYLGDGFEEQYAATPQMGDLILSGLPNEARASSSGSRAVLVSRSGTSVLPN
jgi:hypothetical protein